MCSQYGFGGGPDGLGLTFDLPPMHEPDSRMLVERWAREQRGEARITGRRARNLNPVIHAQEGGAKVELGWWWLHVGGGPAPYSAFNSRDDTLLRKWRGPFQHRGLLPADRYVEKGRTLRRPGGEGFGIAAVLAKDPSTGLLSYSMVTRAAVGPAAQTHPRMPLILPRGFHAQWLDPAVAGSEGLIAEALHASEELARSFEPLGGGADPEQPALF